MPTRHSTPFAVFTAITLLWPRHATAQGTVLDRARKAAEDAANAGKKAATAEVNRQVNSAVTDAATEDVADGSFVAVLSPWSSTDGKSLVQLARYSGAAFVVTTPTGRQVIVCDPKGVLTWQATITVLNNAPATTVAARGAGAGASGRGGAAAGKGSGTGTPARGGGAPPGKSGGASDTSAASGAGKGAGTPPSGRGGSGSAGKSGGASDTSAASGAGKGAGTPPSGRGGGGSAGKSGGAASATGAADSSGANGGGKGTEAAPSATAKEYKLPSTSVTIALPITGAKSGAPSQGAVTLGDVSHDVLAGGAKIRFSQATIPTAKGPQVVDLGVAFKAMVLPAGKAPEGCMAPNAGRGSAVATKAAAPAPAPAARPAVAPAVTPPTGPTFAEGDVLMPKIDNVKLLAAANDSAKVTTTLKATDSVVYLGGEENGYIHVQGSNGEGWVRKALVKKS